MVHRTLSVCESQDLILGERQPHTTQDTAALTSVVTHTPAQLGAGEPGNSCITRGVAEGKAASRWRCEKHFGLVTLLMNMWNIAVFDFREHNVIGVHRKRFKLNIKPEY